MTRRSCRPIRRLTESVLHRRLYYSYPEGTFRFSRVSVEDSARCKCTDRGERVELS